MNDPVVTEGRWCLLLEWGAECRCLNTTFGGIKHLYFTAAKNARHRASLASSRAWPRSYVALYKSKQLKQVLIFLFWFCIIASVVVISGSVMATTSSDYCKPAS